MDFQLDDDQLTLQDAARSVITKECSLAFVRSVIDDGVDPGGWWATMVELGWPALAIAENIGGLGMTWVEQAILLEELGRAVDPSPYLATTTQFVPIVRHCGDSAQAATWLGAVAGGRVTGALAFSESTVHATRADGAWCLSGQVANVVDADRADEIAVVATDDDGCAVFVVNRSAAGERLQIQPIPVFDHTAHIGHVTLTEVAVTADRRLNQTTVEAVAAAVEEATLGWAVTTVGACQQILELALAHVKQRHQFGVPIGSFQAVKHKAVDMYVAVERARALAQYAALTIVEDDPRRSLAISMAKAAAGDCQEIVIQHGYQLFGAMGFTWENDLQMALRRAKLGAMLFGSTSDHRRRVGQNALAQ